MDKPKVLFILENFYGFHKGKLRFPAYKAGTINKKNATYSRILPHFLNGPFDLYFGETSPNVATDKDTKFETDIDWLKKTVEFKDWFAVVACCSKATKGLKEIGFEPFMNLPHPTSWAWRKTMIAECVEKLNAKLDGN